MCNLNYLEIGMRIRKQREALNITREKLAENLDVSTKFISDIEVGAKGMSLSTLAKLSNILKLSTDYILFGDINKTDIKPIVEALSYCPIDKVEYVEQLISLFIKAVS